jgi:hypothetical protein
MKEKMKEKEEKFNWSKQGLGRVSKFSYFTHH